MEKLKIKCKALFAQIYQKLEAEPEKMQRFALLTVAALCGLYLLFLLLPEDVINGVNRRKAIVRQSVNIQVHEIALNISKIPDTYKQSEADKYIADMLRYITKHKDRKEVRTAAMEYLTDNCSTYVNENQYNQTMFLKVKALMVSDEMVKSYDDTNARRLEMVLKCQALVKDDLNKDEVGDEYIYQLERDRLAIINDLKAIQEERRLNKEIYGNKYDETTDTLRYIDGDKDDIDRMRELHNTEQALKTKLEQVEDKIRKQRMFLEQIGRYSPKQPVSGVIIPAQTKPLEVSTNSASAAGTPGMPSTSTPAQTATSVTSSTSPHSIK